MLPKFSKKSMILMYFQVDMMHQIAKFDYADVDDCQILGLPYEKGTRIIFLPCFLFLSIDLIHFDINLMTVACFTLDQIKIMH